MRFGPRFLALGAGEEGAERGVAVVAELRFHLSFYDGVERGARAIRFLRRKDFGIDCTTNEDPHGIAA